MDPAEEISVSGRREKDLHESTDDPAKSESDSISARSEFDKTYKKTQLYNREAKLDKNNS